MARRNLTLQLDETVIRRARIVAAKRGTSVSALTAQTLLKVVEEDERYEKARARAESILSDVRPRGGRRWSRAEVHDRAVLRSE
jgi:hypothetical protein